MTAPTETVGSVADDMPVPFHVDHRAPHIGTPFPLTAAYCAERAAFALMRAETTAETHARLLACADQWRQLAEAMASNLGMTRPREDRDDRTRR